MGDCGFGFTADIKDIFELFLEYLRRGDAFRLIETFFL